MVVPVLMMSCQVSLKLKIGPAAAHRMMIAHATANAAGCPMSRDIDFAKLLNCDDVRMPCTGASSLIRSRCNHALRIEGTVPVLVLLKLTRESSLPCLARYIWCFLQKLPW